MSSVKVVLPVLDLNQIDNPLSKVVVKGVKQITTNTLSADTQNANQALFSFQPPSQNTIIDRRMMLSVSATLTNNGGNWITNQNCNRERTNVAGRGTLPADGGGTQNASLFNTRGTGMFDANRGNNFAPRQLPLMSCIDVIDLEINGTHISVSPKDYIHALMRYTTPEFRSKFLSGTSHYPDITHNYGEAYATPASPFGNATDVGKNGELARGSHTPRSGISVAVPTDVLTYTFTEPLFISPLLVGGEFEGLTNVNQININIRWDSANLNRLFSIYNPNSVANLAVYPDQADATANMLTNANATTALIADAKLYVNYYTPQDDIKIPNEVVYQYNQPQLYIKTHTLSVADNANSAVLVGDNIRINQIPQKMFLFFQNPRGERTAETADAHHTIQSINISWNNQTGILSNATQEQLHTINKQNGLDSEYFEYGGQSSGQPKGMRFGVPLCLEFGKDVPLETGETAGMIGNFNLRVDASFNNNTGATLTNVECNVLLVMNGACIISPNEMRLTLGNVDRSDAMNAQHDGTEYHDVKQEGNVAGLQGGSFIGGFKHLVKGGGKVARKIAEACDKYAPMLKKASAMTGGSESGGSHSGGSYSGGNYSGGSSSGGSYSGGRR
jgi:hypothetical protein